MTVFVSNAFSLQMVKPEDIAEVGIFLGITSWKAEEVTEFLKEQEYVSIVGHKDTAAVMSSILGLDIPTNRTSVTLAKGDILIVGQYSGPRLPEGAMELPEGSSIRWISVKY